MGRQITQGNPLGLSGGHGEVLFQQVHVPEKNMVVSLAWALKKCWETSLMVQ